MSGPLGQGSGVGAPRNAQYVVMVANAALTVERVLTGTANEIVVTDGGAGAAVTLSAGALIVQTDQANTWTTGVQTINTGAAGTIGLIVKGHAGQTANRQEWQDSTGNVDLAVMADGDLFTDRWLARDSNTFIGVGVAGAGNLAHTAGNEGYRNTFVGADAGYEVTTGYANVAVGYKAFGVATTAYACFALGYYSLGALTSGSRNTGIGTYSLLRCVTGGDNTAVGYNALQGAGVGISYSFNVAVGFGAAANIADGVQYVVAVGNNSGESAAANGSVYFGHKAGENHTGSYSVFIGFQSGQNEVGNNKLYISNSNTTTPLVYGEFDGGGGYGVRIHGPATGAVTLTARMIAAQTANIQNWETSAGVALMEVEATGVVDYRWAMGNSTKDPRAVLPDDWVEIKIGGATYYLPAYLV